MNEQLNWQKIRMYQFERQLCEKHDHVLSRMKGGYREFYYYTYPSTYERREYIVGIWGYGKGAFLKPI